MESRASRWRGGSDRIARAAVRESTAATGVGAVPPWLVEGGLPFAVGNDSQYWLSALAALEPLQPPTTRAEAVGAIDTSTKAQMLRMRVQMRITVGPGQKC